MNEGQALTALLLVVLVGLIGGLGCSQGMIG